MPIYEYECANCGCFEQHRVEELGRSRGRIEGGRREKRGSGRAGQEDLTPGWRVEIQGQIPGTLFCICYFGLKLYGRGGAARRR